MRSDARAADPDAGAHQAALHVALRGRLGPAPQDAVAQVGPGAHVHVGHQHRVGPEARPGLDHAARAHVEGPVEDRLLRDAGRRVDEALGARRPVEGHREAPVEDVAVDLQVLLGRADVDPVAAVHRPEDAVAAGQQVREEGPLDRVVDPGRHQLERPRLQDVDARVDVVRGDLLGPGLLEEAEHATGGVRLDEAVGGGVRDRGQEDRRRRPLRLVAGHHLREVDVGEDVPVHHDRALVEEGERVAAPPRRCRGAFPPRRTGSAGRGSSRRRTRPPPARGGRRPRRRPRGCPRGPAGRAGGAGTAGPRRERPAWASRG